MCARREQHWRNIYPPAVPSPYAALLCSIVQMWFFKRAKLFTQFPYMNGWKHWAIRTQKRLKVNVNVCVCVTVCTKACVLLCLKYNISAPHTHNMIRHTSNIRSQIVSHWKFVQKYFGWGLIWFLVIIFNELRQTNACKLWQNYFAWTILSVFSSLFLRKIDLY